ncbi:MAG: hypothetical protein WC549_07655 [Actinomycetota bacterium]
MIIKRKLLILIATIILGSSIILFGCSDNGVTQDEQNIDDPCSEVAESKPKKISEVELAYYDEDKLLEEADLIFDGIVIIEKEIGIEEYIDGELNNTYYRDVFTFRISKVYYSNDPSIENDDIIKIGNESCSNNWIEGTIEMEFCKHYIVLARKSHDTDTVKFTECYDFEVVDPWMSIIGIEIQDEEYVFDEVFTSLKDGAREEIIREDGNFKTKMYVKGKEFENELENLILEKKGEN